MLRIPWLAQDSVLVFGGSLILYGVLAWICHARGVRRPVLIAFGVSAGLATILGVSLEWEGAVWSVSSAAVKTGVMVAACIMPSVVAALVTRLIRMGPFVARVIIGSLCGAVIAIFMPFIAISAVCSALGDCL